MDGDGKENPNYLSKPIGELSIKLFGTYVKLVTFEIECLHMKSDSFVFSFSHSVIFNIIYNQRFKKYS